MSKQPNIRAFLKSQKYFFTLIYEENKQSFILYIICKFIVAVIPPLVVLLNKKIIDSINMINGQFSISTLAVQLVILLFFTQYMSSSISSFGDYIFEKVSGNVNFVLKKLLYEKIIKIPYEQYEDSTFFDDISLANIAITTNGIKVIQDIVSIGGNIISLLGMLGILLSIHWTMPVALFLSTLPGIILLFIVKTKNYNTSKETALKARELEYTSTLFLDRSVIKEIKIYGTGNYLLDKWKRLFKYIQQANLKIAFWEFKSTSVAILILQLASLGVSLLLIKQISNNMLTIGDYVALLGAVTAVQGIFGMIGGNLGSIFETAIYNTSLLKILNYKFSHCFEDNDVLIQKFQYMRVNQVDFIYPNSNRFALQDVSFYINKGENVAIVGHNGSGKTTLLNCILGLYHSSNGEISINNQNINNIHKTKLYSIISAIFQDFSKYKFTVRENLAFGDLTKLYQDDLLYHNLRKVELYDKLDDFDSKLDTYLTKEMPDGKELSGGEWQKLAIARGFLRDTDLIILDEPTAALDPMSELKIFEVFYKLAKDKTIITISHRLGPTKLADRIIVMKDGKVTEQGTFAELMNNKSTYYEMYQAQASWYNTSDDK